MEANWYAAVETVPYAICERKAKDTQLSVCNDGLVIPV